MTPKEHNRTLGILFLVYLGLQAFGLVIGFFMSIVIFGGMFASEPDLAPMAGFMTVIMIFAFAIGALLIIPVAVAGFKLIKERPGARTWAIIASVVALLNFPLGTILGIYGLWFLMGDAGKAYFDGVENPSMAPPPPPHSWQ
jgi:hypothetical protein